MLFAIKARAAAFASHFRLPSLTPPIPTARNNYTIPSTAALYTYAYIHGAKTGLTRYVTERPYHAATTVVLSTVLALSYVVEWKLAPKRRIDAVDEPETTESTRPPKRPLFRHKGPLDLENIPRFPPAPSTRSRTSRLRRKRADPPIQRDWYGNIIPPVHRRSRAHGSGRGDPTMLSPRLRDPMEGAHLLFGNGQGEQSASVAHDARQTSRPPAEQRAAEGTDATAATQETVPAAEDTEMTEATAPTQDADPAAPQEAVAEGTDGTAAPQEAVPAADNTTQAARNPFEERAAARAEARAAALERMRRYRQAQEETSAQEAEAEKQRTKEKKLKRAEKSGQVQQTSQVDDFLKAKQDYEEEVRNILQAFGLGLRVSDPLEDEEKAGAEDLEQPTEEAEPEEPKKRLVALLSEDWIKKLSYALATRSESAVVGQSVEGVDITRRDLGMILPGEPWLNDEVVNAWYANMCARLNEKDGYVKGPGKVPRWVAYSSAWYKNVSQRGADSIVGWSRRKGIKNDKLLQTERIFFPTNTGVHWTLLTISGKNKTIEYLDSLNPTGYMLEAKIKMAKAWLKMELGTKYNEDEWTVLPTASGLQSNSNDCGVFACFNGLALASGPGAPGEGVTAREMPLARQMMAAILVNGGFTGDFDL